jgi:hypothetical protein
MASNSLHLNRLRCLTFALLTAISFLAGKTALAGGTSGGEGDAVVFYSDKNKTQIERIGMFDFWEQSRLFSDSLHINLGAPDLDVESKINIALERLRVIDSNRASTYKHLADEVLRNLDQYFIEDADFAIAESDLERLKIVLVPPKEKADRVRFAYNFFNAPATNKRFQFSKFLYEHEKMTNDVRAAIILHEVIYNSEAQEGTVDPSSVRRMNYLLCSNFLKLNDRSVDYVKYLFSAEVVGMDLPIGRSEAEHIAKTGKIKKIMEIFNSLLTKGCSDLASGDDFLTQERAAEVARCFQTKDYREVQETPGESPSSRMYGTASGLVNACTRQLQVHCSYNMNELGTNINSIARYGDKGFEILEGFVSAKVFSGFGVEAKTVLAAPGAIGYVRAKDHSKVFYDSNLSKELFCRSELKDMSGRPGSCLPTQLNAD